MNYHIQVYGPDGWQPFHSDISFRESAEILRCMNNDDPRPFRVRDVNGNVVLRGTREVESAPSPKTPRPPDCWIVGRAKPAGNYSTEQEALDAARKRSSEVGGPYYVYRVAAVAVVGFVEERFDGEN